MAAWTALVWVYSRVELSTAQYSTVQYSTVLVYSKLRHGHGLQSEIEADIANVPCLQESGLEQGHLWKRKLEYLQTRGVA